MFEDYQICPYTGLRSFTEEESLYFKGREEHIHQATEQLQRQKFLMLTGASGDGKSSLVYAGIIPNARAGFLKSRFSQWCVADFRPERSPFKNLAHAIARQLEIANPATVESELQHGFSALVDLYKNSSRYLDIESVEWARADEQKRSSLKRKASNLIIIVDQFEEFFTNPENYHKGVPSRDSNLVLNVLLETARIALEQDLPIYIVFTMRSDYIGQCAAFRSLPEYIGFSQFFVPRLNRNQLQQVIEEPATLSGNRITRRLTERLIHDIAEGVDQLPILQHALNQIWHAASKGKEEMDLIHYAMVGGMVVSELPDDQVERFTKWFDAQPERIRQFYREPNLQNVLDTHANKLYESAAESYRTKTGKPLSDETAKLIVKTTFTCLTKIDQSRAVRNRMTLQEIGNILNRRDLDSETVGFVLNIFREPGNTFIRPFVTEEPESGKLADEDVLDITHESLIRNWEYLEKWAKEEFDNYTISLDFEKQLNRWVESNKSNGFLLSIGPLTYFEAWYNRVNPNGWWIARYLPEDIEQGKKLEKAEVVLGNSSEFIKRSARKHVITRTIMRYGPKRIAAVLAIVGVITLSSFVASNYYKKQNTYILKSIREQSLQLANSPKVNFYDKSTLLIEQVKTGTITIDETISHVDDSLAKIYTAARVAAMLVFQGKSEPKSEILQSLIIAENHLRLYPLKKASSEQLASLLKNLNYLTNTVAVACVYNPSKELLDLRNKIAVYSAVPVRYILTEQPQSFKEINHFNAALENAISYKAFTAPDLQKIIETLSPFESKDRAGWILKNYAKDNQAARGAQEYPFKFNGLFQELAYLYAAMGDSRNALKCVDSLLTYNQNYYQNDYTSMADNGTNVATTFYTYGHEEAFDAFVKGYCEKKKMNEVEFYQRLIARSHIAYPAASGVNEFGGGTLFNLNNQLSDDTTLAFLFGRYRAVINTLDKKDERNYLTALSFKDEAILRFNLLNLSRRDQGKAALFSLLDMAFEHYKKVDPTFLKGEIRAAVTTDNDATQVPRKFIFLYPDYRTTFAPFEPRSFFYFYTSTFFIEYLLEKGLIATLYKGDEIGYFSAWLEAFQLDRSYVFNGAEKVRAAPDNQTLIGLESVLAPRSTVANVDLNLLYLYLGNEAMKERHPDRVLYFYRKINKGTIGNLLRKPEFDVRTDTFWKLAQGVTNLCVLDSFPQAYSIVKIFKNPINRSSLYAFAARRLMELNIDKPVVQQLIDSSMIELTRIKNLSTGQPNRQVIAHALAMQDPEKNAPLAYATIKNIGNKLDPTLRICRSFAFHNKLNGAQEQILKNTSDGDQANFLWNILFGYTHGSQEERIEWQEYTNNYVFFKTQTLNYINEEI